MNVITIWHNVERDNEGRPVGMLDGYQAHHAMSPVFVYVSNHPEAMDQAFVLFNAPEEHLSTEGAKIARRYRANRFRSLSVGDIVQVDREYFAVSRRGFSYYAPHHELVVTADPYDNF